MELRADLHVHSEYSFDSKSKLRKILKRAKEERLDLIAITDHEEIEGGKRLGDISKNLIVITGEEIDTEYGDIIGLFLKKKIETKKFFEVVKEIKKQGGIAVIPHPALYHILSNRVLKEVDLIEVFNSRVGKEANEMAIKLSGDEKKPSIAGSDAHFIFEIGNGVTIIDSKSKDPEDIKKALLEGRIRIECRRSPIMKRYWTKIVKLWRKR